MNLGIPAATGPSSRESRVAIERLALTAGDAMDSAATYVDVVYDVDRGPQNVATTACVPLSRAQYGVVPPGVLTTLRAFVDTTKVYGPSQVREWISSNGDDRFRSAPP